jgi:hypothetical protein
VATAYIQGQSKPLKVLRLTTMFTGMNGALLVGFGRWLRNSQCVTWKRTARLAGAGPAGLATDPWLHREVIGDRSIVPAASGDGIGGRVSPADAQLVPHQARL